jgi:NADH-quinone oxidoreductase subunit C
VEALLGPLLVELGRTHDELLAVVDPAHIVEVGRRLRDDPVLAFDYLRCLSAVDWEPPAVSGPGHFEVVYHLASTVHGHRLTMKARLAKEAPSLPSVVSVWKGADWHEREAAEMYGITFEGHPNLKPLLLWDGAPFAPQRKSVPVLPLEEFWKDLGIEEPAPAARQAPAGRPHTPARLQKQATEERHGEQ